MKEVESFNLELIALIQNRIAVKYNLGRLYKNNLGFIHTVLNRCGVKRVDREDLLQVAFFAVYDSAVKFDLVGGRSYLSYLEIWLIHYFYEELLRMRYSFRITHQAYKKAKELDSLASFVAIDFSVLTEGEILRGVADGSLATNLNFDDFFHTELREYIWKIVRENSTTTNYSILVEHYRNSLSYAKIGKGLGIGKDRVRRRVVRTQENLRRNRDLQIIAKDWFGIRLRY